MNRILQILAVLMVTHLGVVPQASAQNKKGPPSPSVPKPATPAATGSLTVDHARVIPGVSGWEAQSTVIPPGKKKECPGGRLLISKSGHPPITPTGTVRYLDLDDLDAKPADSEFEVLPAGPWAIRQRQTPGGLSPAPVWDIGSNDHELVALPGGDVLCIWMGRSRERLDPKPDWFDGTYKKLDDGSLLGPGIRSTIFVWRSTDGGARFMFLTYIDMAKLLGGWPAFPQAAGDTPPQKFVMGGTDGPSVRVNRTTGNVYLTMGCAGREDMDKDWFNGVYSLGPKLAKTLVMESSDNGESWGLVSVIRMYAWRWSMVPQGGSGMYFGAGDWVFSGENQWSIEEGSEITKATGGKYGWTLTEDREKWGVRNPNRSLLVRGPGPQTLLHAGTRDFGASGKGYALFAHEPESESCMPMGRILPQQKAADNFVWNITGIDVGEGPVLLYWYDAEWPAKSLTIRGRLVGSDGEQSMDFQVATSGGGPVTGKSASIGDYHTAAGYVERKFGGDGQQTTTFYYFPIWAQVPDSQVRFTRIVCRLPLPTLADITIPEGLLKSAARKFSAKRARVDSGVSQPEMNNEPYLDAPKE